MAAPKLTPPPPTGNNLTDRWLNLLWRLLTADGQIRWVQVDKTGSSVGDMDDVTLSSPQDGEVLVYEGGQWVNKGPSAATQQAYSARHG